MKYNRLHSGLWMPEKQVLAGRYHAELRREGKLIDEWDFDNVITNQGLVVMLNMMFAGGSVVSNWYLALFANNYTPTASDTASSIISNAGEFTSYSGGARPAFTPAAATTTPSINNSASQASYTFTGSGTLVGGFLISSATPGSNSGVLYSAAQFGASKSVASTDQLSITYTTGLSSS